MWRQLCVCVRSLSRFSCVQLFVTLWTIACQAPLSMGFSRQGYWSGLPCHPPGDLPNPGIKHASLMSTCISRQVLYHQRHLWSPKDSCRWYVMSRHVLYTFYGIQNLNFIQFLHFMKYYSFVVLFFSYHSKCKSILTSWAAWKQAGGWVCPARHGLPPPAQKHKFHQGKDFVVVVVEILMWCPVNVGIC